MCNICDEIIWYMVMIVCFIVIFGSLKIIECIFVVYRVLVFFFNIFDFFCVIGNN